MKQDIVLVGGGGHCHSCIDVIESTERFRIVGILDRAELVGSKVLGYEIIGTDEMIGTLSNFGTNFFITVGQIKSPTVRKKIASSIESAGGNLPVIVSPYAYVSPHAKVGLGTIVHHQAFVNANVVIGKNTIINTGTIIEHDVVVGDYCHVSTNSTINGNCVIGDEVFVGSGSVLNHSVDICNNVIIGSASTVIHSLKLSGTYKGLVK